MRKWRAENLEEARRRGREEARLRYATQKETRTKAIKKWQQSNPEKWKAICRAKCGRRRASLLKRTPAWSETAAILRFYEQCPEGHHVDHVLPLRGEAVSGLHVLGNLQYLPASENVRKSNSFPKITREQPPRG